MNPGAPPPPPLAGDPAVIQSYVSPQFPFVLMSIVWLIIVVGGTLVTFILPEYFASTTRIKVEPDRADFGRALNETPATNAYDARFIPTQSEIIKAETILGRVIDILNLNEAWGKRYLDGSKLKTTESLAILRGRLEVRQVPHTTLLDIRVYSENPREAADLANAIADVYQQWRSEQAYGQAKDLRMPQPNRVEVLERAVASTKPFRPNKPLNITLGFVFGGLAGFSLALLVYIFKHSASKRRAPAIHATKLL